ncbi:hypothetical protein LOTGIDRAFT_188125 [Lottia gigantea]|uniref:Poly A polymerase head domain-containing protein n=1 Tax=Lottia gigantea TaxID=225164 RepID=V4ARX7_LOTGI|nr:hypothetical protein LOTGIDRAFT_188125 [Lottia gigantea]ESO96456.1 hypothetical protein LOTGIDRAFT_188125 [Lottia gigantea]
MQFDSPEYRKIFTPELKKLIDLFDKHGFELRIAGGAVRDLMMGKEPADIDFATTATPDQMKEMFEKEEIRMINNKGEKHGTITARINEKNFEVTTLRIDVVTDGRHAEVEFTRDWKLDANRRDLTINAMFLGFDGTIYDYFNGKRDLAQRKVTFVGNAEERIQEDYLRILRYFRFYGRIAKEPYNHDKITLDSIKRNMDGLRRISAERIWMELKKIVCGNYAGHIVDTMISLGMSQYIGLPENSNIEEFKKVCASTEELSPLPMTRMSALFNEEQNVYEFMKSLKISNEELKLSLLIVKLRDDDFGENPMKYFGNVLVDSPGKDTKLKERLCELIKYKGNKQLLKEFSEWSPPVLPVKGHDLVQRGIPKGPIFAEMLGDLRQFWKESNFTASKEELLQQVDEKMKKKGL